MRGGWLGGGVKNCGKKEDNNEPSMEGADWPRPAN